MFRLSVTLFALVGVSLVVTGGVYLSVDEFMPYHAEAVQMQWQELDANFQGLMLGLIKGLGGGALVSGASILYMTVAATRNGPRPYLALLPVVAVGYCAVLCYATYTVETTTPGKPPLLLTGLLVVVSVLASIALIRSQKSAEG